MKNKYLNILVIALTIIMLVGCTTNSNTPPVAEETPTPGQTPATTFPDQDITGIVQWGAGGGTDSLMRPLSALAEEILGKNIVVQNKAGATGAIEIGRAHV